MKVKESQTLLGRIGQLTGSAFASVAEKGRFTSAIRKPAASGKIAAPRSRAAPPELSWPAFQGGAIVFNNAQ